MTFQTKARSSLCAGMFSQLPMHSQAVSGCSLLTPTPQLLTYMLNYHQLTLCNYVNSIIATSHTHINYTIYIMILLSARAVVSK